MIKTKADLKHYIEEDGRAEFRHGGVMPEGMKVYLNPRLLFVRNLRYYEYYANKEKNRSLQR